MTISWNALREPISGSLPPFYGNSDSCRAFHEGVIIVNKSGVPGTLRRKVFYEGNFTCDICNIKGYEEKFPRGGYGYYTLIHGLYLSIDHIIPKSKGGSHKRENLRILCTKCNSKKGTKNV